MRRRLVRTIPSVPTISANPIMAACGALIASVVAGGCQKPLFPPDTPRTPFELHDKIRDRYRPTEEPDVFGKPQPALRARLGRQDD